MVASRRALALITKGRGWTLRACLVVVASSTACVSTDGTRPEGPIVDAGPALMMPVPDAESIRSQTLGAGTERCSGVLAASVLQMAPEAATAFDRVPRLCDQLGTGFMIRNSGPRQVRIDGLSISPAEFSLESLALPLNLEPGASLPVRAYFEAKDIGSQEGTLTVSSTTDECTQFDIHAVGASGTLVTRDYESIDFGRMAAGTLSDIQRLRIVTDRSASDPEVSYTAFSTDKPDTFELVSAPSVPVVPSGCEPIELALRVRAPQTPGRFEGNIVWRTLVRGSSLGEAEATMIVLLFGEVTAP